MKVSTEKRNYFPWNDFPQYVFCIFTIKCIHSHSKIIFSPSRVSLLIQSAMSKLSEWVDVHRKCPDNSLVWSCFNLFLFFFFVILLRFLRYVIKMVSLQSADSIMFLYVLISRWYFFPTSFFDSVTSNVTIGEMNWIV